MNTKFRLRSCVLALFCLNCSGSSEGPVDAGRAPAWRIKAPVVQVPDVGAALSYYCEVLRFHCPAALRFAGVDADEGDVYAIVERGGAQVHLQIRLSPVAAREPHEVDFIVAVDDAAALFVEFETRGVRFAKTLETTRWGSREFTIEDPFGNRATFATPTAVKETHGV